MLAPMSEKSEELYDEALAFLQGGDIPKGIAVIEECLMEDSQDPLTWRLYGVALTAAGRPEDAAAAMKKAQACGLDDVESFLMKATEAQMAGNLAAVITHFEDALELKDDRFEIWGAYALALLEGGYDHDALEASKKATTLGAEHPQAWYARGRVLRLTGDMEGALTAFDRAVALDAKTAVAWHERGMVLVELGDLKAAVEAFERVLKLQPDDAAASEALRIVSARMR
jgi:tetratricopeptide (TPR) repeat protein